MFPFLIINDMNQMKTKIDADKVLDELIKTSSKCIEIFGEKEEVREMRMNEVKNELKMASEKIDLNDRKVYTFSNGQKEEMSNKVVIDHPESLLNVNMIDIDSRNRKNEVEIDFRFKYLDEMMKYMANEFDINELNGIEFVEFCRELIEMNIPFKMDIMNRIYNGSNEYGVGWKNRSVVVKRNEVQNDDKQVEVHVSFLMKILNKFFRIFKKRNEKKNTDTFVIVNEYKMMYDYMSIKLSDMKYNDKDERFEFVIDNKYESIIQCFIKFIEDGSSDYNTLIEHLDRRRVNEFVNEGLIDMNNEDVHYFFFPLYSPFLRNTILFGNEYDDKLREWVGDYKWRLLYRASENDYTAESFHEYCDNKGPTLVIIKSDGGWLFGGYTTRSWSGRSIYNDMI